MLVCIYVWECTKLSVSFTCRKQEATFGYKAEAIWTIIGSHYTTSKTSVKVRHT